MVDYYLTQGWQSTEPPKDRPIIVLGESRENLKTIGVVWWDFDYTFQEEEGWRDVDHDYGNRLPGLCWRECPPWANPFQELI